MHFEKFKEQNAVIAENQDEYLSIPGHIVGDKEGTVITRIVFSPEEIETINKTGGIYMSVLTFGKTFGKENRQFPPLMIHVDRPFPYLQHITDEVAVVYYKETNQVNFYTPNGTLLWIAMYENFQEWTEIEGFNFKYLKLFLNMFDTMELHLSADKKTGIQVKLNTQYLKSDDQD